MNNYLIYIGKVKGVFIGVPARDLNYSEAKKYGITNLLAFGLYVYNSQDAIPKILYDDLNIHRKKKKKERE